MGPNRAAAYSRPFFIGITGGSGSGKTTLAKKIASDIKTSAVTIISEDNYYIDHSKIIDFEPRNHNFDDIAAHDHDLLLRDLHLLRDRFKIYEPQYSFDTHSRSLRPVAHLPTDIVIVEGIHCLYPEKIRKLMDYSIYLDVPDDIRFIRRLTRDMAYRGRSVEDVVKQYLEMVRPMHYRYTYPAKALADLVLSPQISHNQSENIDNLDLGCIGGLRQALKRFHALQVDA